MTKAILEKLPEKAQDIFEAAWQDAKDDGRDDETAAKVAIAAVTRAGYARDEETGMWKKMLLLPMHITKATLGGDGVMRWAATVTKFEPDDEADEITPEFYRYAKAQVASGKRPDPVLCVSHIDHGKPDDSWVAGNVTDLYIDGTLPKAKGIFRDTPLGRAAFEAVRDDYGKPDDEKTRISLGFYPEEWEPITVAKSDGQVTGRRFKKGWIKHLALTRAPIVKETEISILEEKSMKTKKEDAASIVGEELAEELTRKEKASLEDDGIVLKQEADDSAPEEKSSALLALAERIGGVWAERLQEKSVSLDDFRSDIWDAWRAQFPSADVSGYDDRWIKDVLDDAVIVYENGKCIRIPYVVDLSAGDVEFGAPAEVEEVKRYVPTAAGASVDVTAVPRIATKAEGYDDERENQILDVLMQLADILGVEWSVDTEMANARAMGSTGTNPPRAEPAEKSEPGEEKQEGITSVMTPAPPAMTKSKPASPREVEIAAFVDSWAMQVKATLVGDGDRQEKFATLQQLINSFGDGVQALVKERTPPSSRDITDVINQAVQAAVGPLQDQLAGVKAELTDIREKATVLGQGARSSAPRPTSLDTKARVVQPQQVGPHQRITPPGAGGIRPKAKTAKELAWASTAEGPGY